MAGGAGEPPPSGGVPLVDATRNAHLEGPRRRSSLQAARASLVNLMKTTTLVNDEEDHGAGAAYGEAAGAARQSLQQIFADKAKLVRRSTLLDPKVVAELEATDPGLVAWLRSSSGLLLQVGLFVTYVGLDATSAMTAARVLQDRVLHINPNLVPIVTSFIGLVIGVCMTFLIDGQSALMDAMRGVPKFFVVSIMFAMAQCFRAMAFAALGGSTVKTCSQVKLLQTALLSSLLLKRRYVGAQWGVMIMVCLGCGVFLLGQSTAIAASKPPRQSTGTDTSDMTLVAGLTYTFLFLLTSDLGSIFSEKFMKQESRPFYAQKASMEVTGLPVCLLMSFVMTIFEPGKLSASCLERCGGQELPAHIECRRACPYENQWWRAGSGGLFANWRLAVALAVLLNVTQNWISGILVKKLSSVMKLLAKVVSNGAVYFIGACWLMPEPWTTPHPWTCTLAQLICMTGTYCFMVIPTAKAENSETAAAPTRAIELAQPRTQGA